MLLVPSWRGSVGGSALPPLLGLGPVPQPASNRVSMGGRQLPQTDYNPDTTRAKPLVVPSNQTKCLQYVYTPSGQALKSVQNLNETFGYF